MLDDFLRINMPYGLETKDYGKSWAIFNREYMPLGFNNSDYKQGDLKDHTLLNLPLFTEYGRLATKTIMSMAENAEYDDTGGVTRIWLYKDNTNPHTYVANWPKYAEKLRRLSRLKRKSNP